MGEGLKAIARIFAAKSLSLATRLEGWGMLSLSVYSIQSASPNLLDASCYITYA
ncbi:MAG: hypothetical protein VKJ24_00805 [Synechococcales bacterium]|nr:hypothetical protein [Synechococcales bacterium]